MAVPTLDDVDALIARLHDRYDAALARAGVEIELSRGRRVPGRTRQYVVRLGVAPESGYDTWDWVVDDIGALEAKISDVLARDTAGDGPPFT